MAAYFVKEKNPAKLIMRMAGLAKSTYYYKKRSGKPGRKPSSTTRFKNETIANEQVMENLSEFIGQEFIDYGYKKLSKQAKREGYVLNSKKLYRMMSAAGLLKKRIAKSVVKRTLSPYRKPRPKAPYECVEMDFKYIYCKEKKANVYLLTVLDVFTRRVIDHDLDLKMPHTRVLTLWNTILENHKHADNLVIRTDNGSQFVAQKVADYFESKNIKHEFTKKATPEENGHIESWHATLERELLTRNHYETYHELNEKIRAYILVYNTKRLHSSIGYNTPDEYFRDWQEKNKSLKAEEPERLLPQ